MDDRRKFLKTVGGASAALAGAPALVGHASAAGRPSPTGGFALEIDGVADGYLRSIVGGEAFAEVVHELAGPGGIVKKHLANPRFREIELTAGHELGGGLYSWIRDVLDRSPQAHDGALLALDAKLNVASRREFFEGLLTEVAFPALDGTSKDPAFMTVKIAPEETRVAKPQGEKIPGPGKKSKLWIASNFRLKIDGLDATKVNKIDAFVVKQRFEESDLGGGRAFERIPLALEVGDLVVTMLESGSASFADWFEDFVIKGNNDDGKERSGSLEFLAPDLKSVLFTLEFKGLGIYELSTLPSSDDKISRFQARMYCEQVSFSF